MSNVPSQAAMQRAIERLMEIRFSLEEDDPSITNDPKLYGDMLEGEGGNAMDVIARYVRGAINAEALAEAARVRRADLADRVARFDRRAERLREAVRDAMQILGLKRLEQADFTASVQNGPVGVRITNEDILDHKYCRITRAPDKIVIGKALKAGEIVEGAELSNPQAILVIREA